MELLVLHDGKVLTLVVQWSVEEYFKAHSTNYRKPFEISHWEALVRMKKLLEWPNYVSLSLESDKHVTARETLKRLTKLMDQLHGICASKLRSR